MSKFVDLTGKEIGRLIVLNKSNRKDKWGHSYWACSCSCGNFVEVLAQALKKKNPTKSCGCLQKEKASETCKARIGILHPLYGIQYQAGQRAHDLTGKIFSRLTVIERTNKRRHGQVVYRCKCECGNFTEVLRQSLVEGYTKSCGCLQSEIASKMCKARIGELHPGWNPEITDRGRQAKRNYPEYKEWRKSIFIRDNYICQKCGKVGGKLNAHHIEGYANNEELRTSIDNGITLCRKHHTNLHHLYGNDVGRENLEKWLSESLVNESLTENKQDITTHLLEDT